MWAYETPRVSKSLPLLKFTKVCLPTGRHQENCAHFERSLMADKLVRRQVLGRACGLLLALRVLYDPWMLGHVCQIDALGLFFDQEATDKVPGTRRDDGGEP